MLPLLACRSSSAATARRDVVWPYVQLRGGGAPARGCAPSTTKRRQRVVDPQRRAFTALAAAPAGTSSPSCARSPTWAMWRRSSSWPPAPACPCRRRKTRKAAAAAACWRSTAAPPAIFSSSSTPPRRRRAPPAATGGRNAACPTRPSAGSGWDTAPDSFTGLLHYLKRRGFSEPELEESGLVKRSAKGNLYDIFRIPGHGAHHRRAGQHHRLWRPRAGRLQAQVHQQPRNDGLQKVPHAVRAQRGQKVPLQAVYPVRGLHGRYQHARGRL